MTEFVTSELYPDIKLTPAMLINKQPSEDKINSYLQSGDYFGQIKRDGAWYQLLKQNNNIYLFGRSPSKVTGFYLDKIDNVPHIKEWAEQLPDNTTLIGEIYYPGGHSNDSTKIMGCKAPTAVQRQKSREYGPIHYYIHDIIQYDNIDLYDMPAQKRLLEYLPLLEPLATKEVEIAKTYENNLNKVLTEAFAANEEGMVFKNKNGKYQGGKRPAYNFKVKTETTFDAFIIGFVSPEKIYTGKEIDTWPYWEDGVPVTKPYYNNWVMGVVIGAFNDKGEIEQIGTIASGFTDFYRQDMAENEDEYMYNVIEIQAMSVDKKNHTIRHGRFIRMRPDKDWKDCTIKNIF